MAKTYHTRVIVLQYCGDDAPEFKTGKERQEWEQALGRQVTYGMAGPDAEDDTTQLVLMFLSKNPEEIQACYHNRHEPTRDENGFARYGWREERAVDDLMVALRNQPEQPPYVIGAVKDSEGKWGFHS